MERPNVEANLSAGLERIYREAAENLSRYKDFEVEHRQTCKELEDEKMAREAAEKRIVALEMAVEAASNDLKLEKLRLQGVREQILRRESQFRAFHSTVAEIAKVQHQQQDQLSTILRTFEFDNSVNDHDNTNVQSTSPSSSTPPGPLHQQTPEHQSSKRLRRNTSQEDEEKRDYWKEVMRRTSGEGAEYIASQIATNNIAREGHAKENAVYNEGIVPNDVDFSVDTWLDSEPEVMRCNTSDFEHTHFEWGVTNLEKDAELLGQDMLPAEEPPPLLVEVVPDYEGHEDPLHHSTPHELHSLTRVSVLGDNEGNCMKFSLDQRGQEATSETRMRWRTGGDMAATIAELQALGSIFFTKLLRHTHLALSRRQQMYLPVWFINQHGDKLEERIVLRTRSSTRMWRVGLCVFKKPCRSPQAQICSGWNGFVIDNHLKNQDILIFVLDIETTSFQVYIFRSGSTTASRKSLKSRVQS